MRRSTLVLPLTATGGSDVRDTAVEMCRLARTLDVIVSVPFNGVDMLAYPHSMPTDVYQQWDADMRRLTTVYTREQKGGEHGQQHTQPI